MLSLSQPTSFDSRGAKTLIQAFILATNVRGYAFWSFRTYFNKEERRLYEEFPCEEGAHHLNVQPLH